MDHETELRNLEQQLRIHEALAVVADAPRAVFDILVDAADPERAREALRKRFGMDWVQASAVLDAQLRWITASDRQKLVDAHRELTALVAEFRGRVQDG